MNTLGGTIPSRSLDTQMQCKQTINPAGLSHLHTLTSLFLNCGLKLCAFHERSKKKGEKPPSDLDTTQ